MDMHIGFYGKELLSSGLDDNPIEDIGETLLLANIILIVIFLAIFLSLLCLKVYFVLKFQNFKIFYEREFNVKLMYASGEFSGACL